jgi:hypothetical protein
MAREESLSVIKTETAIRDSVLIAIGQNNKITLLNKLRPYKKNRLQNCHGSINSLTKKVVIYRHPVEPWSYNHTDAGWLCKQNCYIECELLKMQAVYYLNIEKNNFSN